MATLVHAVKTAAQNHIQAILNVHPLSDFKRFTQEKLIN